MKYLITFLIITITLISYSQCVLTTGSYTEAQVETCLSNCGCSTIEIPNGNTVEMDGDWDLTTLGPIEIEINGPTGQLVFTGSGGNASILSLDAGSTFSFTGPFDNPPLVSESDSQSQPRVSIGDDDYYAQCNGGRMCLDDLIALFLPIKLNYFRVIENEDNFAILEWETLSEDMNLGFAIVKNGVEVDFIDGAGDSESPILYQWIDEEYTAGNVQYQLIQYDIDGSIGYSSDFITYEKEIAEISVFPNPAITDVTVVVPVDNCTIKILDLNGKLVVEQSGENIQIFNVSTFSNGMYLILIEKDGKVLKTEKLIIR